MLTYDRHPFDPGRFQVRSTSASALAAVPDALVQVLGLAGDMITMWGLHPTEQVATRDLAYENERSELGVGAVAEVVEVLRPRRQNVVWIDRLHLVASGAPAAAASRLLGLYVGSEGSLLLYVHHPASAYPLTERVRTVPHSGSQGWDDPAVVSQARFAVHFDGASPAELGLASAPAFAQRVPGVLDELARMTAGWG